MSEQNASKISLPPCPLTVERERLGLSRLELAEAAGLSYSDLYRLEAGYLVQIRGRVRTALAAMGSDVEALDKKYRAWRGERGRSIIAAARQGS
jgi:hypothetical protein